MRSAASERRATNTTMTTNMASTAVDGRDHRGAGKTRANGQDGNRQAHQYERGDDRGDEVPCRRATCRGESAGAGRPTAAPARDGRPLTWLAAPGRRARRETGRMARSASSRRMNESSPVASTKAKAARNAATEMSRRPAGWAGSAAVRFDRSSTPSSIGRFPMVASAISAHGDARPRLRRMTAAASARTAASRVSRPHARARGDTTSVAVTDRIVSGSV